MKTSTMKRNLPVVNDVVTRRGNESGMQGLVLKVTKKAHLGGGAKALVTVSWPTGYVGVVADTSVTVVERAAEKKTEQEDTTTCEHCGKKEVRVDFSLEHLGFYLRRHYTVTRGMRHLCAGGHSRVVGQ
jgi:hypothetical protein